jgi:signal transduction histidine kinase
VSATAPGAARSAARPAGADGADGQHAAAGPAAGAAAGADGDVLGRARPDEVAVLAPSGRDGPLAERVLGRWGIRAVAYDSMDALGGAIERGVGAAVVAEEALRTGQRDRLLDVLGAQPSWSDVPVIVLTAEGELSRVIAASIEAIAARGNVTLLERPVRVATLVTTVRSALRARERQYDVRDYLAELRTAREVAEAANRAKSDFLAVMSHELRTPLNAIGGYAELIELGIRGPVTEEQHADLERIQKSQRHLLGLINGVLNYARVEAGNVAYEVTDVRVDETLATCEALVAPQARARGLTLQVLPCPPALHVRADREKTQQILLNLLTNAIKFTEPDGRITVDCSVRGGQVAVRVADTGRGIPAEKLASIFEPFVQVDARLTRAQEGVGLGLAISRDLARGMSGDLTAASVFGVGSTFVLTLPAA